MSAIVREEESSSLDNWKRLVTDNEDPEGCFEGRPDCARMPRMDAEVKKSPTAKARRGLATVKQRQFARGMRREVSAAEIGRQRLCDTSQG